MEKRYKIEKATFGTTLGGIFTQSQLEEFYKPETINVMVEYKYLAEVKEPERIEITANLYEFGKPYHTFYSTVRLSTEHLKAIENNLNEDKHTFRVNKTLNWEGKEYSKEGVIQLINKTHGYYKACGRTETETFPEFFKDWTRVNL